MARPGFYLTFHSNAIQGYDYPRTVAFENSMAALYIGFHTDPARIVGFRTTSLGQGPGGYAYVTLSDVSLEQIEGEIQWPASYFMTICVCGGNFTYFDPNSILFLTRAQSFFRVTQKLA